jgi:DNA-binding CsgD family transcriptional regulator
MAESSKIEAERQRIAQRINEDIIAALRLIQTQTETYRSALQNQPDASMALTMLSGLLQQVVQRTLHLRNNLHPTVLETLGLEAALEIFAADMQRIQGLHITLHLPRLTQRMTYDLEIACFRTIQSLIDHAVSHIGAAHFDIRLQLKSERIVLQYEDDGRWLPSQIHILQSLQEDIAAVKGNFEAQLTARGGLHVQLHIDSTPQATLTPREQEVLQCVAEGMTNKDIAAQLHLGTRTVSFHLDNIFTKLHVNTRTEAVMVALQKGWIQNPAK